MKRNFLLLVCRLLVISTFYFVGLSELSELSSIKANFSTFEASALAHDPGKSQVALTRQISMKTLPPPQVKV